MYILVINVRGSSADQMNESRLRCLQTDGALQCGAPRRGDGSAVANVPVNLQMFPSPGMLRSFGKPLDKMNKSVC